MLSRKRAANDFQAQSAAAKGDIARRADKGSDSQSQFASWEPQLSTLEVSSMCRPLRQRMAAPEEPLRQGVTPLTYLITLVGFDRFREQFRS